MTLVVIGLASLELIWILLADLRNRELGRLYGGKNGNGATGAAAHISKYVPDNFWTFLGISTGILVIGVLLSAWAHDPIADRWRAVTGQRDRTEDEYTKLATEQTQKLGELESLLSEEATSPERLALVERISHWYARSDIAQRAHNEYHLAGYWKDEQAGEIADSLSGLTRLRKPLSHGDPPQANEAARDRKT